jgi:type IV pilus assembly protein PilO
MNLDIDIKDPRFLRWAGAILVVAVLTPLWFTQTMLPVTYAARQEKVKQLEARHHELSRDLEKARLLVRNLERVEREYETLRGQWEVASTLLPEENEMPALLRKVTAAGKQSGIDFKLFRPEPTLVREFYTDNPVSVRVQGGYHQTGVFLSRLANLNRIVNVENLRMEGIKHNQNTDENVSYTVETELTLTAYTLSDGPVPDGAAAGTKQLASADGSGPKANAAASH